MALRYPSELKKGVTYTLTKGERRTNLGKFLKRSENPENALMSYGSSHSIPASLVFENKSVLETEVFPKNEWARLSAPTLTVTTTGGKRTKKKTLRKSSKKSARRKSRKSNKKSRRKSRK